MIKALLVTLLVIYLAGVVSYLGYYYSFQHMRLNYTIKKHVRDSILWPWSMIKDIWGLW